MKTLGSLDELQDMRAGIIFSDNDRSDIQAGLKSAGESGMDDHARFDFFEPALQGGCGPGTGDAKVPNARTKAGLDPLAFEIQCEDEGDHCPNEI